MKSLLWISFEFFPFILSINVRVFLRIQNKKAPAAGFSQISFIDLYMFFGTCKDLSSKKGICFEPACAFRHSSSQGSSSSRSNNQTQRKWTCEARQSVLRQFPSDLELTLAHLPDSATPASLRVFTLEGLKEFFEKYF